MIRDLDLVFFITASFNQYAFKRVILHDFLVNQSQFKMWKSVWICSSSVAGTCFHTHTQTFKGVRNRENEQAFSKIRKEKLERHIKLQAAIHVSNFILIWNIWICFKATSTVWAHRRCSIPTLSAYNLPHWQKKALFCCKSCPLDSFCCDGNLETTFGCTIFNLHDKWGSLVWLVN